MSTSYTVGEKIDEAHDALCNASAPQAASETTADSPKWAAQRAFSQHTPFKRTPGRWGPAIRIPISASKAGAAAADRNVAVNKKAPSTVPHKPSFAGSALKDSHTSALKQRREMPSATKLNFDQAAPKPAHDIAAASKLNCPRPTTKQSQPTPLRRLHTPMRIPVTVTEKLPAAADVDCMQPPPSKDMTAAAKLDFDQPTTKQSQSTPQRKLSTPMRIPLKPFDAADPDISTMSMTKQAGHTNMMHPSSSVRKTASDARSSWSNISRTPQPARPAAKAAFRTANTEMKPRRSTSRTPQPANRPANTNIIQDDDHSKTPVAAPQPAPAVLPCISPVHSVASSSEQPTAPTTTDDILASAAALSELISRQLDLNAGIGQTGDAPTPEQLRPSNMDNNPPDWLATPKAASGVDDGMLMAAEALGEQTSRQLDLNAGCAQDEDADTPVLGPSKSGNTMPEFLATPKGLGKPLRIATDYKPKGATELKALLSSAPAQEENTPLGTVQLLSPVRTNKKLEDALGAAKHQVLTPVRRSARTNNMERLAAELGEMLEDTDFCYAPNAALQEVGDGSQATGYKDVKGGKGK